MANSFSESIHEFIVENKWELVSKRVDYDQDIEDRTERMRVTNGWIYKTVCYQQVVGTFGISMLFVPEIDRMP